MPTPIEVPAVLVAANRTVVYGTVCRWLLHDLRNPAQALSLVTELIEPGTAPDPDLWATLRESARQLTGCVELLDRTLRTPSRSTAPGPIVLSDIFDYLSRVLQTHRSMARIDIPLEEIRSLPAVAAIEYHLEHAILNLLMNAIEATGDRENGQISISAAAQADDVVITIDDNGPGVASQVREHLFQPYITTKPTGGVTGLGLTVARHLIERVGGTVAYAPKADAGARFVARLPAWGMPQR